MLDGFALFKRGSFGDPNEGGHRMADDP